MFGITPNVGSAESNVRLIAGVVILALAFLTAGVLQLICVIAGALLIATSILRFCPAYMVMNKSTVKEGE
jgi:hypothetical protein